MIPLKPDIKPTDNNITEEGEKAFVEALKKNTTLTELDLNSYEKTQSENANEVSLVHDLPSNQQSNGGRQSVFFVHKLNFHSLVVMLHFLCHENSLAHHVNKHH